MAYLQRVLDLLHVRHEPEVNALQPCGVTRRGEHLVHIVQRHTQHLAVTRQPGVLLFDL
jgi:hypothetical protein